MPVGSCFFQLSNGAKSPPQRSPSHTHHSFLPTMSIREGIDLSDKSRRWYIPLHGYISDLCIANSWLVYKRDWDLLNKKLMTLRRFHPAVAQFESSQYASIQSWPTIIQKDYTPRLSRAKPQPDVRYDNYGHWPLQCDKREMQPLLKGCVKVVMSEMQCSPVFEHKLEMFVGTSQEVK